MDVATVERHVRRMIEEGLGFDLSDPNLRETPIRIARMYCNEFFETVGAEHFDLQTFPNDKGYDQIIISDKLHFTSICSHHFLPFSGYGFILYIPDQKLVGLSKMSRILTWYSKRPQLQENLCNEVIEEFVRQVQPLGAMVFLRGTHGCMSCRGVMQYESGMGTSAVRGGFKDNPSTKAEGLELIKIALSS